jgi:molybdopterin-dependent oxidoreductase alpha subunit
MGIWEKMNNSFHDKLGKAFGFESPTKHGYDVVDSIKALADGKAGVFFAMGGNFLSATPDTDLVAKGMKKCALTVHVSTKPNRSHLITGDEALILPCKVRSEVDEQKSGYQFVSVENSMGKVSSSKGVLPPISENLMSEVEIVANMAHHTLAAKYSHINWLEYADDYDKIRDQISKVINGFHDYNTRIRDINGFYLPNPARDRSFTTSGKAIFTVNELDEINRTDKDFLLTTVRSHDQYNTTIYGLDDRYRGIQNGRKILLMNMSDMEELKLNQYEKVDIFSKYNGIKRMIYGFKAIPYNIPKGNVAAYFPEANPLVPIDLVAKESNTPVSKSICVRVVKNSNINA